MNIFVLDLDPTRCAQYHCDKHVVKMILETAQILSTVDMLQGRSKQFLNIYKATHINHLCVKWAGEFHQNYSWLTRLGMALCEEYTFRYGKYHASSMLIVERDIKLKISKRTPRHFALAMPDQYRTSDPVESYRAYYRGEKSDLLQYKGRDRPEWL